VHPGRRVPPAEQAFGDYDTGERASCALGAAYEAMYRLPARVACRPPTRDLDGFVDCLDTIKRARPKAVGSACRSPP
jgi:hypothetical protein